MRLVYANAPRAAVPLAYALAELLGLPARDWPAYFDALRPPVPDHGAVGPWAAAADLEAIAGVYRHPADGPLCIERAGAALVGRRPDGHRMDFRLEPVARPDHFIVRFVAPEWRGNESPEPPLLAFVSDGRRVVRADWLQAGTVREHLRDDAS